MPYVFGTWGLFFMIGGLSGLLFGYLKLLQKRSTELEHKHSSENAALSEIGRIISSSLDIDEIYESFASHVRNLIPCDVITINTVDY